MAKEIRLKPKEMYVTMPASGKGKFELVFKDGNRKVVVRLNHKSFEELTTKLCESYIIQHMDDDDEREFVNLLSELDSSVSEVSDGHDGTYRIHDDS